MNKKKKINKGLLILGLLFIAYLIVLYSKSNGYYDYKEYNKMIITKESMAKFEEDVKNGKNLSASEYITSSYKDYSNIITKVGAKVGDKSKELMTKGLTKMIRILGKFFK